MPLDYKVQFKYPPQARTWMRQSPEAYSLPPEDIEIYKPDIHIRSATI